MATISIIGAQICLRKRVIAMQCVNMRRRFTIESIPTIREVFTDVVEQQLAIYRNNSTAGRVTLDLSTLNTSYTYFAFYQGGNSLEISSISYSSGSWVKTSIRTAGSTTRMLTISGSSLQSSATIYAGLIWLLRFGTFKPSAIISALSTATITTKKTSYSTGGAASSYFASSNIVLDLEYMYLTLIVPSADATISATSALASVSQGNTITILLYGYGVKAGLMYSSSNGGRYYASINGATSVAVKAWGCYEIH